MEVKIINFYNYIIERNKRKQRKCTVFFYKLIFIIKAIKAVIAAKEITKEF